MGTRSKNRINAIIAKEMLNIHNYSLEVKTSIKTSLEETLDYLHSLISQIPESVSGPLITKTPKVPRKRDIQRIETIPENEVMIVDNTISNSVVTHNKTETADEIVIGRIRRQASKIAADNIKKQQSLMFITKLRRPSTAEDNNRNSKRESRFKRKKSPRNSSDEESMQAPTKHSKMEENILSETISKKITDTNSQNHPVNDVIQQEKIEPLRSSMTTRNHSNSRKRTLSENENIKNKNSNIIDDTVIAPTGNDIEEPSIYEDAIEKPIPIMNSTMNLNSTLSQKIMNATVVLEPLSAIKLNETVTINKKLLDSIKKSDEQKTTESKAEFKSPKLPNLKSRTITILQDKMQQLKEAMVNKEFDELFTDDQSSPEVIKPKENIKKQEIKKRRMKRQIETLPSSEDEILNTPVKPTLKQMNTVTGFQEVKNIYKSNALFSPYAKESVKKRVEAFEQAGNTPKLTVDDAPTRITRTKTRAKARAEREALEDTNMAEKAVTQKLARKSLAKAKKISLAKQTKDVNDKDKENKSHSEQRINKLISEKINCKQQQKTTPLSKTKTQLPVSVNRNQTPANQINVNHNKVLNATRSNIITSMESLIPTTRVMNKRNSLDKMDEKRKKLNDEDARKKREEALRLQTEEKRRKRQEKELKNKLAREAKEKQDMEKRQRAEKEREEKARLAQQMQEKQREEMEKKRLAQLQRAQEKEERRKQEEQQRLQRLQEQEEAERILAEQRRREQEAEKRKEAEQRAQQQAATEAMKAKHQMLMSQIKYGNKPHGPTTYVLDSEPDDDESDDESKPKHIIPYWAQSHVRKVQLAIQRYIPEKAIYKFFDTKKCTPDLTQMFQGIDRSRLKRTSSAIWKTPPRYSMMGIE